MKNQIKHIVNSNKGYSSVLLLLFLLPLLAFFPWKGRDATIPSEKAACYIGPDSSRTISYQSATYDLIKENAALSTEQFGWHMKELEKIQYGGQERILRRAKTWSESEPPHPEKKQDEIAGFLFPEAKDLLFLDRTDQSQSAPGYIFVDIFLKEGIPIPNFIKNFCDEKQPIDAIKIFPDANGKRFPPAHLRKNDVEYTLFAFERINSDVGRTHNGDKPHTDSIDIDGKQYPVGFVSFAEYLALYNDSDGFIYLYSKKISPPIPTLTGVINKSLQLNTFEISTLYPWGWWSPECKPAIYLYPKETTQVSVKVSPKGYLTYTDPPYPVSGWNVEASPNGTITANSKKFDYLYYESKIEDSAIRKPDTGYVVAFNELPDLYSSILPKLGLSEKETKDFKDYWEKTLPQSPYYFVGVMKENDISAIEPLTISPKPDTMIRVRLYFEALNEFKKVEEPLFSVPKHSGFTVVEWGGMVKTDKDHPFTCSQ